MPFFSIQSPTSGNATQLQGRTVAATGPTGGQVLTWDGSSWAPLPGTTGPTGAAGVDGRFIYSGSTGPLVGLGRSGDYYIDFNAGVLYGPKASNAWGSGLLLQSGQQGPTGPSGVSITGPTGAPSTVTGPTGASYLLPVASSSMLGGIKVGEGLLMIDGVLSAVPSSGGGLGADEAIDGGFYPVTSAATITISEQPSNQTAISGAATFSAAASVSGGAISYQWQKQEGGTGLFSNVSGATSSTLALTGLTAADNGDVYQVVVSSSVAESVTSNFATLTVGSSPVASSGTLWGWGAGNYGKIGDGTTTARPSQTQVGSAAWVKVSAGTSHSIGIKSDGTLWAWGRNAAGELGDGTTTDRYSPVQVGSSAAWAFVSAGLGSGSTTTIEHSMAIKSDGTLWGWGANSRGQLGSGSTHQWSTPAQIGSATWLSVSAAYGRTLAIKSDGTLWAWGSQPFGELGDGTTTQRNSPVQVGSSTWLAVSAGQYHTLAIKSDGTLWGWGYNFSSQLSSSSATTISTPTQIGSATWSYVSAGYAFSHAIKSDGTMWGWGLNADNQVGDGTSTNRATPVQIATGSWVSISSGAYHAMAIKSGGTLWGWGLNSGSVIQSGSTLYINSPTQVGSGSWVAVEAGTDHSMGIKV
jgi:alpha-tubulin suppressor-like RCC1 family protein